MGQFLVRRGFITREHVREILNYQRRRPRKFFGQLAVELGYLDEDVITLYFKERAEDPPRS
ncbi:MAG: hypothetical protein ACLFUX_09125 [Spirochaetaceae bacterium]